MTVRRPRTSSVPSTGSRATSSTCSARWGTFPGIRSCSINQYYAPFDAADHECLADSGLTAEKIEVLLDRLGALNAVIANGAETFGYATVQPDFTGHGVCSDQSYVQGEADPAPLHPNARGHLVIALADERELLSVG